MNNRCGPDPASEFQRQNPSRPCKNRNYKEQSSHYSPPLSPVPSEQPPGVTPLAAKNFSPYDPVPLVRSITIAGITVKTRGNDLTEIRSGSKRNRSDVS